jgi:hypothetical protein
MAGITEFWQIYFNISAVVRQGAKKYEMCSEQNLDRLL